MGYFQKHKGDVMKNIANKDFQANSQNDKLKIEYKSPGTLKSNPHNSRIHTKKQVHQIAQSEKSLGFNNPVLIDADNTIIAGHGRVLAAKELGLTSIPTICLSHLSPEQVRAFIIADNKLCENAGWDKEMLKIELDYLINLDIDLGFDATVTGFEIPEIDSIINIEAIDDARDDKVSEDNFFENITKIPKRVKRGDIFQLGEHKLICANALEENSYKAIMSEEKAQVNFTDPPYNLSKRTITKQKHHKDFVQAAGEMNRTEFVDFLLKAMTLQARYSVEGSIHFQCMDWRHMSEILEAGYQVYSELKNLCVWDKGTGGMGSFYRSQHELIFVFKNGNAKHINNIELGVHGRYRTNVWKYKGMHACNPQTKTLGKLHMTVKPTSMIMDALLDCSEAGGIVLDSFGGSGSTLIAAERTKRKARLIEIESKYCDVIIYRYEKLTGKKAEYIGNIGD